MHYFTVLNFNSLFHFSKIIISNFFIEILFYDILIISKLIALSTRYYNKINSGSVIYDSEL